MNIEMALPDISTTGGSVKIIQWLIEPGQPVKRGQPLLEVETDKSVMEVEAFVDGVLLEILAAAESDVEVGQVIAVITSVDENRPVQDPNTTRRRLDLTEMPTGATPQGSMQPPGGNAPSRMSMFERNRQKTVRETIDSNSVNTAGVEAVPTTIPEMLQPEILPQTSAQRVVAQRMLESKQNIPHFYLQSSANAEQAARHRDAAPGEKPSWDSFFINAAGKALKKFPRMCVSFIEGQLISQVVDAVGLAVDFEGDLFICSIRNPADKTPEVISAEIAAWVQRLREGDQQVRKVQPGNITVTNLGAVGIETFTAVINPPEAAILAVGKVASEVVAVDGQVTFQKRVRLTLSVDHRVVNGRYAAEFLAEIIRVFENP